MFCVLAPFDQLLPLLAEELKVKLFPEQRLMLPEGVIIGADGTGFTVKLITELVAVFGLAQGEFEVIMHCTTLPLVSTEEVNTALLFPVFTPFTCHWYEGELPPLLAFALKVMGVPIHAGLLPFPKTIFTEGIKTALTVTVITELIAVGVAAQEELETI